MNIPTMPTDSLYKWVSIFGLTTFIFSGYLFISKLWEYRSDIPSYTQELEFLSSITRWGIGLGFLISFWGFSQWHFRLQKYINMEIKAKAEEQEIKTQIARLELEAKLSDQNN